MSAAPTVAMLAAVTGVPYTIPFTGPFPYLYVREAASAFVAAVSEDREDANVFDLNGVASTIEEVLDIIRSEGTEARIACSGNPFPFPADLSDKPITDFLGPYRKWSLDEGVAETLTHFRALVDSGKLSSSGREVAGLKLGFSFSNPEGGSSAGRKAVQPRTRHAILLPRTLVMTRPSFGIITSTEEC